MGLPINPIDDGEKAGEGSGVVDKLLGDKGEGEGSPAK